MTEEKNFSANFSMFHASGVKMQFTVRADTQDQHAKRVVEYLEMLAASLVAQNEDEATGKAYRECLKHFPVEAGWWGHAVGAHEIPRAMIDKVIDSNEQF